MTVSESNATFPCTFAAFLCPQQCVNSIHICPNDKRGVAREQIDPKRQGPTNVSKILNDVLDLSQKNVCAPF